MDSSMKYDLIWVIFFIKNCVEVVTMNWTWRPKRGRNIHDIVIYILSQMSQILHCIVDFFVLIFVKNILSGGIVLMIKEKAQRSFSVLSLRVQNSSLRLAIARFRKTHCSFGQHSKIWQEPRPGHEPWLKIRWQRAKGGDTWEKQNLRHCLYQKVGNNLPVIKN